MSMCVCVVRRARNAPRLKPHASGLTPRSLEHRRTGARGGKDTADQSLCSEMTSTLDPRPSTLDHSSISTFACPWPVTRSPYQFSRSSSAHRLALRKWPEDCLGLTAGDAVQCAPLAIGALARLARSQQAAEQTWPHIQATAYARTVPPRRAGQLQLCRSSVAGSLAGSLAIPPRARPPPWPGSLAQGRYAVTPRMELGRVTMTRCRRWLGRGALRPDSGQ